MSISATASSTPASSVPFYANQKFINAQRITGLALIVLAPIVSAVAGAFGTPILSAVVAPIFVAGSVLIGATLIQQAIGNTPGCEKAKLSRIAAGVFVIAIPVFGWIPAAFLWAHSHNANKT